MDSTTVLTTLAGVLGALAPAVLLVSSHYKKLRDDVVSARSEFSVGISSFQQELKSGLQLVHQKIATIERQIADQQNMVSKLQDANVDITKHVAILETKLAAAVEDLKTHTHSE
jgi:septal ring factor EnvC (AmiA/AmiB activator)